MAVFLEVRHRIKPITNTAFDLFVDFYADTVMPAMDRHGIDLFGAWKVTGGEMGWDLSIHRYESMAHAEECLNSLGQDTGPLVGRRQAARRDRDRGGHQVR